MAGHVKAADKYAHDVREGRIPACRWVMAACLRYENDRAREGNPDWPYTFDAAKAESICAFIEYLPHTKGKWAADGKRLKLSAWQSFIYVNVFGFLRVSDRLRRFRDAMVVVPRKNGKSLMSAGTGLYMLTEDGEHGAEVYAGATTEKQAWEVFRPAKQMAQGTPALLDHYGVEVNASNIHRLSNGSRFEPLIGKPGDGASPSCAIIDEYHEHADSAQFDTMLTGMGARDQPLMWVITTAGDNISGPCYDKLLTGRQILDGTMQDEEKFFIEYSIDVVPVTTIFQSCNALRRLEESCTCGHVHHTLIERWWREACASHAIPLGEKITRLPDAASTQTDPSEQGAGAEHATNSGSSTAILNTKPNKSRSALSGRKTTETELRRAESAGDQSLNPRPGFSATPDSSNTASRGKPSTHFSPSRAENAGSANPTEEVYAWITATERESSEDSCVSPATLRSAFSEILKKAYNEHSDTCGAKKFDLSDRGLELTTPADDWTSEDAIRKANPNLDVSVSLEFLLARQREAVNNAREQGRFKTKHLDLWVQSRNAYFNMQKWASCRSPGINIEDFAGRRAWLGLDLASEIDLAAVEVVIEDGDGFVRFGHHYAPEDTVEDPKNKHYQGWMANGRLTVTDGAMIDFERIEEDIVRIAALFRNAEVAFDQFQATFLVTRLMARSIECVKYPQQVATMSPAMKRLDALITDGKLRHDCDERDPMTWMMSNVVARVDAKDNVYPRKERPENKIDGPVALMMAVGRAISAEESPYADGRSLLFV